VLELVEIKGRPDNVLPLAEELFKSKKAKEEISKLYKLTDLLEWYGVKDWIRIDLGIARGFDYYTSIVFEAISPNELGIGSIGGGGRYDNLIEIFGGKPTPATGFAIGIERLLPILEWKGLIPKPQTGPEVFVMEKVAINIAVKLRREKIKTDIELSGRKLGKALDYANRVGAKLVIIVGKRDVERGVVTIRDMESGEQYNVSLNEIVDKVKNLLKR